MDLALYSIFNFVVYSFAGWIIEELYCLWVTGGFKTDGFLIGPFKPMYGITGVLLILFSRYFDKNIVVILILCFLVPSIVEGVSGYGLKMLFGKQYWDYSILKYNFYGLVSLKFSIYWMLLSFVGLYFVEPIVYNFFTVSFRYWLVSIPILTSAFFVDLFLTVKRLANI